MQRVIDWSNGAGSAERRLEQLLAGYHQFLAHDLANQLVVIQGYARLLPEQLGGAADPEARLLLNRLADLTRRADQQCRRLADMGRLLREPGPFAPTALSEATAEAVAEVRSASRAAGQASDIGFDVIQHQLTASVPRRLLHRILVELLHNAVAAGKNRPLVVRILPTPTESGPSLTIHDNGVGMTQKQLDRLGAYDATGHGWFFVAQAVACWRGRITVTSGDGQGTTVTLLWPEKES